MSGQWSGSTRRAELPDDWYTHIRPAVLTRDGYACVWAAKGRRCGHLATDVDHVGDRDDHSLGNLRSLCGPHHDARTSQQGNEARWQQRQQRPTERHAGLR